LHPVFYIVGRVCHGVCLGRLRVAAAQCAIDLMNNL
jgi:hypothetical protein